MTTLKTQPEARESQDEELSRLRAEVAAWRARYAASSTRDLAFVNSGGEVAPLFTALDAHFDYLESSGLLHTRRRGRLRDRVIETVDRAVRDRIWSDRSLMARLDALLPAVEEGSTTPLAASEDLVSLAESMLARSRSTNREGS